MTRIVEHLSVEELERRYRAAQDVTEARHTQAIWVLAQGRTVLDVAGVLAFGLGHETGAWQLHHWSRRRGEPAAWSRVAAYTMGGGAGPMLTRTAIYEGALEPGTDEDEFFAAVREKLEPIWRTFPEVLNVRVHRVRDADPGAIPIIMILEMDFADGASLDRSLASDIKERSHALTLEVLKPFKGRFFHLVAEAHSVPA